ncbi:hypothetical protein ACTFIW_002636 [Dictyostelium discoideum]
MPHISVASSVFLFTIIFIYSISFIFTILIPNTTASYTKLKLSNSLYENDEDTKFSYFAQFYKNQIKITKDGIIPKYNEGVEYIIDTCTYEEIESSEFKNCGNLTGINNTQLIINNINKINTISNSIYIIIASLILINILISLSVYKLILPSTSKQININQLKFNYQKRIFLFKYFRLSFLPLLIPTGILINYYTQFDNYFTNIPLNDATISDGNSFGFAVVSIVFNCMGVVSILGSTIFYLTEILNSSSSSSSSSNIPYVTPNGENIPLKNNNNNNNKV